MNKNLNIGILILRLSTGVMMLLHGIAKIQHGAGGVMNAFEKSGVPAPLAYTVYITEVLAPLMLIVGFRSRIASLLVAGTMAVVMLLVQPEKISQITATGAWAPELQALYLFGALALFFTGGGKYALSSKHKWD